MAELASFLLPLRPLRRGSGQETALLARAVPQRKDVAGLRLLGQQEDQWCWAAVSQAVLKLRRGQSVTQEAIARRHQQAMDRPACSAPHAEHANGSDCGDGTCGGLCNDQHYLRIILTEQRCFGHVLSEEGAPTFEQIQAEIQDDKPVPCRIQWHGGGGHFVLVSGCSRGPGGAERVHILDPDAAEGGMVVPVREMDLSAFVSAYTQGGREGYVNYSYKVS